MTTARTNNPVRIAAAIALAEKQPGELMLTAYDQLKPSERIFVDAYIATDSPTQAIRAAMPNLAENVVNVRAMDMLKRPLVKAAIADKINKVASRYEVTAERIVAELAKIAYANMGDYLSIDPETGKVKMDLTKVDRDQLSAVAGFDVVNGVGIVPKLHDKLSGLDKLAKKLGIYAPAGVQLTGPGGGPVQMVAITADMSPEQAADYYQQTLEME